MLLRWVLCCASAITNGNFVVCPWLQNSRVHSRLLVRTSTCTCPTLNPKLIYVYTQRVERLLIERQRVDRRRIEDAFFQYAVLRAASWYPDDFCLYNLPLHGNTTATIENMTCVYHGAFMRKYAGMFNHRHVHATIVQFVCRTSHVTI